MEESEADTHFIKAVSLVLCWADGPIYDHFVCGVALRACICADRAPEKYIHRSMNIDENA